MTIDRAIEQLSVYFTNSKYEDEVLAAKALFFGDVGIDDKESDRYEQWMNLFFDWYLFSRPIKGMSLPPAKYALEIDEFQQIMGENVGVFEDLSISQHGLHQFIKIKGDKVYFKDLFSGKKKIVVDAPFAVTLTKGTICDFRTVQYGDDLTVTKGFCAHPMDANKFILKEIKEFKKGTSENQEELLLELVRMFFKLEQYSHLQISQVYTRDSKVRF
jgi:hypothetical protein